MCHCPIHSCYCRFIYLQKMLLCFDFRLLGEVDAFDLGHTFDPKTFGIWMGTKILVGKDKNGQEMAVLLLDTEGIGKELSLKFDSFINSKLFFLYRNPVRPMIYSITIGIKLNQI